VSTNAPQATIGFSFDSDTNVTLTHEGGDNIEKSEIEISVGGSPLYDGSGFNNTNTDNATRSDTWSSTISTGDELTIPVDGPDTTGEVVRVVWTNPSGGSSNTLAERQWPN